MIFPAAAGLGPLMAVALSIGGAVGLVTGWYVRDLKAHVEISDLQAAWDREKAAVSEAKVRSTVKAVSAGNKASSGAIVRRQESTNAIGDHQAAMQKFMAQHPEFSACFTAQLPDAVVRGMQQPAGPADR